MRSWWAWAVMVTVSAASAACGGAGPGPDQGEEGDTGSTFPAFKSDVAKSMPQLILGNGGPVLTNAKLVTITFPSDDPSNVETIENFSDAIGSSQFWKDATSEYGVLGMRSDPSLHVHIDPNDMPRMTHGNTKASDGTFSNVLGLLDTDLVNFVASHAQSGAFPPPDDETLYAIYIPKDIPLVTRISTTVGQLDRMGACDSFEGFHFEKVRRGREADKHLLYTLIYEACGDGTIDNTTDTASHELAEGATDPFAATDDTAALNGFDKLAMLPDEGNDVAEAVKDNYDANDRDKGMQESEEPPSRRPSVQGSEQHDDQRQQRIPEDELRPGRDERDVEEDGRREQRDEGKSKAVNRIQGCPHRNGYTIPAAEKQELSYSGACFPSWYFNTGIRL